MVLICCLMLAIGTLVSSICLLISSIILLSFLLLILFPMLIIFLRQLLAYKKNLNKPINTTTIGIFHPYCNAGGGGERVLWKSIESLQKKYKNIKIYVYTGDVDVKPDEMLKKVKDTFDINLDKIDFIYLTRRKWVEAYMYPRLTLLAQSIGSMYLGFEALYAFQPDIFIDTMGYAFTYPLFKYLAGSKVVSYTHYPTISTDMLQQVQQRIVAHNNHQTIANNPILSRVKIIYYQLFSVLYGYMGRCADIVMVNSTWTEEHINNIWKCPVKTFRVYPPCDIEHLVKLPLDDDDDKTNESIRIVSVAQFRPEKNHKLMINVLREVRDIVDDNVWKKIRLVLVGSCRNDDDKMRVDELKELSKTLGIDGNVEFKLNVTYDELIDEFKKGTIGLHAMWNEHFGISVVECMAAGLITIANNSGGPRADIVKTEFDNRTGFLASAVIEYATIIADVIHMNYDEKNIIRNSARLDVDRFSSKTFEKEFIRVIEPLF
ncbi:hypothetical protein HCN44_002401 [Aphidius gifuensis]|uniref:GDP-Man:Man(3)GlcNAc(2)-PP-Dol alpha-1,2-mannosyltransferase n=1 Tax=Aphidius gifuensis TaxID=684658 RepID=A0A835CXM5_APHGI|nr:GDP-Man:Man(3)GlcNAc(2)-PP-Dol alpha-1,2-mannosyltransferase-like [Aphidius gifuensis]KAF7996755.1 hypothetical protein HCN44_002401 [Aphidius gifuensis]